MEAVKLFLLIAMANSAPVMGARILGSRFNFPVDGGLILKDGYPLFGKSKTWRGLILALLLTALLAYLLDLGTAVGVIFGLSAMVGDLFSSFIKRRMGKKPSSRAPFIDQLPEAFFPMMVGSFLLDYGWGTIISVSMVFSAAVILLSPLLFQMGIRKKPF